MVQPAQCQPSRGRLAWPSLWIEPLGSSSLLRWDANEGNGRVRFVSSGRARVVVDELMDTLARFVDQVVDRLAQDGIDGTPLNLEWTAVRTADKDESDFCRSAASLGLDPFDIDPATSAVIIEANGLLEETDFDILMSSARPSRLAKDMEWIRRAEVMLSESPADSAILAGLRLLRDTSRRPWSTMPWKIGYETASAVRRHLHITIDEKIELDSYAPISFLESPDPGLIALAGCWNAHSSVVLGGRRGDAGERFVQAGRSGDSSTRNLTTDECSSAKDVRHSNRRRERLPRSSWRRLRRSDTDWLRV